MLPRSIMNRWKVHESTQKGLVRLGFLLLVFLPCVLTTIGISITKTPWYRSYRAAKVSERLSSLLGMQVSVGAILEPSPKRVVLVNVQVIHPETEKEILRARIVDGTMEGTHWRFRISQPELQGEQLAASWRMVHDWFLCRPQVAKVPVSIEVSDLSIHNAVHSPTMIDIQCSVFPSMDDVRATLRYRFADTRKDQGEVHVDLVRYHRQHVPSTVVTLDTGGLHFPLSTLGDLFPSLRRLGDAASLQGEIQWKSDDLGRWEIRHLDRKPVALHNMDWASLTSRQMTGRFDASLSHLWISNGRIQRAGGHLVNVGEGLIGRDLLLHTGRELRVNYFENKLRQKDAYVRYNQLQFGFDLSSLGLKVWGIQPTVERTVEKGLLFARDETLLFEPTANANNERLITLPSVANWCGPTSVFASLLPSADGSLTAAQIERLSAN